MKTIKATYLLIFFLLYSNLKAQELEIEMDYETDVIEVSNNLKKAKIKIEPINSTYSFYYNETVDYKKRYGILKNGKMLLPQIFKRHQYNDSVNKTNLILSINNKYGLFNLNTEKWIIKMDYKSLNRLKNGTFVAKNNNQKIGIIDTNANIIVDFNWTYFASLKDKENYFIIKKEKGKSDLLGVYSIADKKTIIPCEYSSLKKISNTNYYEVKKNDKYNLIDLKNNLIFKKWYKSINPTKKTNHFFVKIDNKIGIIDNNNKIITPIENRYYFSHSFSDGSYLVQNKDSLYGCINSNGQITVPFIYTDARKNYDILKVTKNNKKGIIKYKNGNLENFIACEYNSIKQKNNLFIIEKNNKFGILNYFGNAITKIEYDKITTSNYRYSSRGIFIAQKGSNYYFITSTGKIINKKPYKQVEHLSNYGIYLKVKNKNNKFGLVDIYGKTVIPISYSDIITGENNFIIVAKKNKVGIYHLLKQKIILDIKYDNIIFKDDGFYAISDNKFYKIKIDDKAKAIELN